MTEAETNQKKAYAYALTAVFFWSTVASAFKLALRYQTPVQLLLASSIVASVALGLVLAGRGRLIPVLRSSSRDLLHSAGLGFLNPFLYYAVLFEAYNLLPGQMAQPLNYTWAIALAVLSIPLLKQPIRPAGLAAILVSFAGVYVISTRGDVLSLRLTDPLGVFLALGSSLIWALFWIFNVRDRREEVEKLFLSFLFGALFTAVYAGLRGQLALPGIKAALGGLYSGLFEMGITFVLWLRALKLSRTTAKVSNLIFLSPFVSLVLLGLIVGEDIHISSVAGLTLIVAGIWMQRRFG